MSLPHCVSSAALDIEHGREGGHFALQKRPHNLVAPNAVAHIATSQKGLACTPRDPKCGRFFFAFLDFGQISPPAIFGQPWPATGGEGGRGGGGGRGGPTPPAAASRGLEHPHCIIQCFPTQLLRCNPCNLYMTIRAGGPCMCQLVDMTFFVRTSTRGTKITRGSYCSYSLLMFSTC